MGVGANSSKNKALNDKKERAAGRMKDRGPERESIKDFQGATRPARGAAAGAFGKKSKANRKQGNLLGEGGGGGGASPNSRIADLKARKR
jgi:hypothetical protein